MTTPPVKTKPRGFTTVQEYRIFEESVEKENKFYNETPHFQKRPGKCVAITGYTQENLLNSFLL